MTLFQNSVLRNHLQNTNEKTEKEIDRMVYVLYGLSEEEISVVEGNR
jgi:hypothetical protein